MKQVDNVTTGWVAVLFACISSVRIDGEIERWSAKSSLFFVSLGRMTFALTTENVSPFTCQTSFVCRSASVSVVYIRIIIPIASAYNWHLHHCWHLLCRTCRFYINAFHKTSHVHE